MSLAEKSPLILNSGNLKQHAMVELLGVLFACRRSGELVLIQGKLETRIFAYKGIPINASTNSPGLGILDLMLRDKRLSGEQVAKVRAIAAQEKIDPAEHLKEKLKVSESEIYYYQMQAAKETIIKSCGFREGDYTFTDSDEIISKITMYELNPLEIIYEGMMRYHITNLANDIFAVEAKKVMLNPETKDHFLLPEPFLQHSYLLDNFMSEIKVGDAINIINRELGDINLAMSLLYMLIITRKLIFSDGITAEEILEADECEAAVSAGKAGGESAETDTGYSYVRAPKKSAPQKDRPPATRDTGATRERIRPPSRPASSAGERAADGEKPKPHPDAANIRKKLKIINEEQEKARNLYDLLGVTIENGPAEIREAFSEKMDYIDRKSMPVDLPDDLAELLEKVTERFDHARMMLSDPDFRIEYESSMFEEEKKRAWKMALKKSLARKMENRGKWYMRNNAPQHAISCFEQAVELDPQTPEYYMEMGWATYRYHPGRIDKARNYLDTALKANPKLDMAYYYLGMIAKREGDAEEADRNLRRALALNPENVSANRELNYLGQSEKQKSIWKKIFR